MFTTRDRHSRRGIAPAAGQGLAVLFAAMVAAGTAAAQAKAPSALKVVPAYDVTVLDPISSSNAGTNNYAYMVYDTLFALDKESRPQPQMVESFTVSDDKLTYRFVLRSGLTWHDGAPVTAEDCVASLKRWAARDSFGQELIRRTKELKAADDQTIEFVLKEPFSLITTALARTSSYGAFMMPKRIAATDAFKPIQETVGSGPFIYVKDESVPGVKLVFRKNDKYVPRKEPASNMAGGKVVHFDRIEWIVMNDPMTAVSALERGEVDLLERPLTDLLPQIDANPDLATTMINPVGRQEVMRMNHLHPPFDNPKARQAMYWLTRQEDYLQAITGDPKYYKVCYTLYMCGSGLETDAGTEALKTYDPKKAAALFKEAGWDFSKPIVVFQATDNHPQNVSALVAAQKLREIGLTVKLEPMDWATATARRNNKGKPGEGGWHLMFSNGPVGYSGDPLTNNYLNGRCEKAMWGWPCDETIEKLRTSYLNAPDEAARKALSVQIQERAYEIGTHIPLGQFTQPVAHRKDVTDLIETSDIWVYWNMRRAKK